MPPVRFLPSFGAAALAIAVTAAGAQTMRPGLWEVTTVPAGGTVGHAMAELQRRMASMPAAQRRQAEAQLERQSRLGPDGTSTRRVCVTRDMIARNALPTTVGDRCTAQVLPRIGNRQQLRYVCTQPPSSGEGTFTFASPEAYTLRMQSSHGAQGTTDANAHNASGRWLGPECTGGSARAP